MQRVYRTRERMDADYPMSTAEHGPNAAASAGKELIDVTSIAHTSNSAQAQAQSSWKYNSRRTRG
jgi:hypothetical protein